MLPLWLALAASLLLHVSVLMAPGWPLPDGEASPRLEATLALIPPPQPSVPPAPARKKSVPKHPLPRPKLAAPVQPQSEPMESSAAVSVDNADAAVETPTPESPAGDGKAAESPPVVAEPAEGADVVESAKGAEGGEPAEDAVPPAQSFVSRWPRRGRILYQVTRGDQGFIIGQSEHRWEWDDTRYELQTVAETTGLVSLFRPAKVIQTSRGIFDAHGVRPLVFVVEREGRESETVRFAQEEGKIMFSRGGSAPYVAGTQDLLSVFFHLAGLPLEVPEYFVNIATARKLASYRVSVDTPDQLDTPLGTRMVQRLTVLGRPGEDVTEFWLDSESRLPLKIRYRDRKGEVYEQIVLEIDLDEPGDLPR